MNTRSSQKIGYAGMKLDMSKEFDRLEWSSLLKRHLFILGLIQLGLTELCNLQVLCHTRFVLMIHCRMSYKYLELGLRQRDPLSRYFFILCTEWLHFALSREIALQHLAGIRIKSYAPDVSHIMFVDELILAFPMLA